MKKIELYDKYGHLNTGMELVHKGIELIKEITSMGYSTYIVGGCVRDLLMGKTPHDIDIATNMPIDVIKQHYNTIEYGGGERHGTVIVHHQGEDYELTQFRSEGTYSDNRRPDEVLFVDSFKEDSLRRDFTINAMGIDCDGNLIDYHGGLEDINKKIIRTVGDAKERFTEDSLRILRAVRFATRMDFKIHEDTEHAMRELGDTINNVSRERIRDEFKKSMNVGVTFSKFLRYLCALDITQKIFPEFKTNSLAPICRVKSTDKVVNFALMFPPSPYEQNTALKRLKLNNTDMKSIKYCHTSYQQVYSAHMNTGSDVSNIEQLTKIFNDINFHYLIDFFYGFYNTRIDITIARNYSRCIVVYDLDKEVNAYITSLGITGNNFGHTVSNYREWVFNYFYYRDTLPLEIEWKKQINGFINETSTQLSWKNI